MIFGFLGKFGIDIGKIFPRKIFFRDAKRSEKVRRSQIVGEIQIPYCNLYVTRLETRVALHVNYNGKSELAPNFENVDFFQIIFHLEKIFFGKTFYLCQSQIFPGIQKSYLEIRAMRLTMRKTSSYISPSILNRTAGIRLAYHIVLIYFYTRLVLTGRGHWEEEKTPKPWLGSLLPAATVQGVPGRN